jgi:hypothetical protein
MSISFVVQSGRAVSERVEFFLLRDQRPLRRSRRLRPAFVLVPHGPARVPIVTRMRVRNVLSSIHAGYR